MSSDHDPLQVGQLLAAFDFAQANTSNKREMETLLLAFIEVIDSLQTLEEYYGHLADTTTARIPLKGTAIVVKQALKAIADVGVIPMNCKGQPLDLLFHEVVEVRPSAEVPVDAILEEVERGYAWRNKVLRQAKVVIAGECERAGKREE
jgi:molecular chaperone GrpE